VYHTITGSFTGNENEVNLVVAHGTRMVMYRIGTDGLEPIADVPIYGRIAALHTVKLPNDPVQGRDSIFFLTERYYMCIVSWEATTSQFITRSKRNVSSRIGRPAEEGPRAIVDPHMRCIGMHLYDGAFKIIPLSPEEGTPLEEFNVQLDELQVIDIQFLHNCQTPTICVLYRDDKDNRHIRTYVVVIKDKNIQEGPWSLPNMDPHTSTLIPVPKGGVLILSDKSVLYQSQTGAVHGKFIDISWY
jgi:DNA damage-binding protein 1